MGAPEVHFEFGARDSAKLGMFYGAMFDWGLTNYGPSANMIDTKSTGGINGHINQLGHEPHNYCVVYVQVDDIPQHISKAEKLGGSCLIPAQEVPGMGHFAWMKDPEGNVFGLWKPMTPA